jgi:hypothetical protein
MLVKIDESASINMDYVINLYIKQGKEIQAKEEDLEKYFVVARMIDASIIPLFISKERHEAEIEYNRYLVESNKD